MIMNIWGRGLSLVLGVDSKGWFLGSIMLGIDSKGWLLGSIMLGIDFKHS